jgi:hypothetical protein
MSYILDALKKAEHESEAQLVDNDIKKHKKWLFFPKTRFWFWIGIMLLLNILSFTVLFWPKKPLVKPQVYIVAPTVSEPVSVNQ